mmetsp:Transcript_22690/g.31597  ORF Transcript_22690/g.31597 Transcript_22690/m.31597 type:complete len:240 (-) Transcript_22690:35-754(-)
MAQTKKDSVNWLALESNPDVLNKYIQNLGVPGSKWQFIDVLGFDEDLLQMVPRPVCAVLLLFPITEVSEEDDQKQLTKITKEGQSVSDKLWFMKQTIGNACGTIGVLHSLANNAEKFDLKKDAPLSKFLQKTASLSPEERADALIASEAIAEAHEESAKEGQTETPALESDINLHFVVFVERDGHLYELDGRKPFPVNHGPTSPDTLLEDAVKVVDHFIKRDPEQVNFSTIALAAPAEE